MTQATITAERRTYQNTLKNNVSITGTGLFTGSKTEITICPAEENFGIVFQRMDLPSKPCIPASLKYIKNIPRCTSLEKEGVVVQTVEHLLSALSAFGIHNALIQLSGSEIPIEDGSSYPFIEMIEKAGIEQQKNEVKSATISTPVYWESGDVQIIALPSSEYRISYTLHYPQCEFLGTQFYSCPIDFDIYKEQIAKARTFCLFEEIEPLLKGEIIKGGGLHNALIFKNNEVLNPEGMRFKDEPVKHKILDLVGDLSLIGIPFVAHIIAIRSGHSCNVSFAKKLKQQLEMEMQ